MVVDKKFISELGVESEKILAKYAFMNSRERTLHEAWAVVAKLVSDGQIDIKPVSGEVFDEKKKEVTQEVLDIRKSGNY